MKFKPFSATCKFLGSSNLGLIGSSFLVSMILSIYMVPSLFLENRNLLWRHSFGIPYENTFTILSHYYHGGVQLWNQYDQMSYAYSKLTMGFYTLSNLFTAFVYIILAPFVNDSPAAYHTIFTFAFFGFNTLLRTVGGFFLAQTIGGTRLSIFLSLIFLNTLLSTQVLHGFELNNLLAYLPLLLALIINFVRKADVNFACAAVVLFSITIANSTFFTLSYFYYTIHFFTILALLVYLRRISFRNIDSSVVAKIAMALVLVLIIVGPYLLSYSSFKNDFHIENSGVNGGGRLANILNPMAYFDGHLMPMEPGTLKSALSSSLEYSQNSFWYNWIFIGATPLIISIIGLVGNQTRLKVLFLIQFCLLYLGITSRPTMENFSSVQSIAHIITAFSNPFSFLLNHLHMIAMIMPYFLFPLVLMGIEYSLKSENVARSRQSLLRNMIIICLLVFGAYHIQNTLEFEDKTPALALSGMFVLVFVVKVLDQSVLLVRTSLFGVLRSNFALAVIILGLLADVVCARLYIKKDTFSENKLIAPSIIPKISSTRKLVIEYQNPEVLPFRYEIDQTKAFNEQTVSSQNSYGLFLRFTPLSRYYAPNFIYHPKHISYKEFISPLKTFLEKNQQFVQFFEHAINSQDPQSDLTYLVENSLDQSTLVIDGVLEKKQPGIWNSLTDIPHSVSQNAQQYSVQEYKFSEKDASLVSHSDNLLTYAINLPSSFPEYISTSLFTADTLSHMSFVVGNQTLLPVQGYISESNNFDVQNIKKGELRFSLSEASDLAPMTLRIETPSEFKELKKYTLDQLEFNYAAEADGWLLLKQPYDTKFRVSVNDQKVAFFKANLNFMAIPVRRGEQNIKIDYDPDSWLRALFFLSNFVAIASLLGMFYWLFRQNLDPSPTALSR